MLNSTEKPLHYNTPPDSSPKMKVWYNPIVSYNRVITPGRMQKNLGFETEIAQWADTRQFFLGTSG